MNISDTYPGSTTRIVDSLPVYECDCGYVTWALTRDKPPCCKKCGNEMKLQEGGNGADGDEPRETCQGKHI